MRESMRGRFATGKLLGVVLGTLALGVFALVPGEAAAHGTHETPVPTLVSSFTPSGTSTIGGVTKVTGWCYWVDALIPIPQGANADTPLTNIWWNVPPFNFTQEVGVLGNYDPYLSLAHFTQRVREKRSIFRGLPPPGLDDVIVNPHGFTSFPALPGDFGGNGTGTVECNKFVGFAMDEATGELLTINEPFSLSEAQARAESYILQWQFQQRAQLIFHILGGECKSKSGQVVKGLTSIADFEKKHPPPESGMAQKFEDARGNIVDTVRVERALLDAVAKFKELVLALPGTQTFAITSGFRPTAYQAHLYELVQKRIELLNADPANTACTDLKAKVDDEIDNVHKLVNGINRPGTSLHELGKAVDISITGLPAGTNIDALAKEAGLHRPCGAKDPVHYSLKGAPCQLAASVKANSPVNILLQDPLGRRVGFDPATGTAVNDLGDSAIYSGPGTTPQEILLGEVLPGAYTITGVSTGTGTYTISLQMSNEDDPPTILVDEVLARGEAVAGQSFTFIERLPLVLVFQATTGQFPEALAGLVALIDTLEQNGGITHHGIATSLRDKLTDAEEELAEGDFADVRGILGAFLNEIRAQRGEKITEAAADDLTAYASYLREFFPAEDEDDDDEDNED